MLDYKESNKTFFVDQDTINVCLKDKIQDISIFYNFFRKYKNSLRGAKQVENKYSGYVDADITMIHIAERNVNKSKLMDDVFFEYRKGKFVDTSKVIQDFYKDYKLQWGRVPDIKNPHNLDEIWFSKYMTSEYQRNYYLADKLQVREFVKERGLSNILIPLIDVFDTGDVDINRLPQNFALKLNTGVNHNIFFRNGNRFNQESINQIVKKWLSKTTYRPTPIEVHYDKIIPRLYAERYIGTSTTIPTTYEVYCVKGEPIFITVADFSYNDKTMVKSINYIQSYDIDWKLLPWYKRVFKNVPKPKALADICQIASKLSRGIDLARVDLFDINGKIFFNEITISPGGFIFSSWNTSGIEAAGSIALSILKK